MNTRIDRADDVDELLSVSLTRVLNATPQAVFEAWTDPQMIARWWGPKGYESVGATADPRPGGEFSVTLRDPQGEIHTMAGVFAELNPPSLVCLEVRHRQFEGAADTPEGYIPTYVRVELSEHADGTQLHLVHNGFVDAAIIGRFQVGWTESLERLHEALSV